MVINTWNSISLEDTNGMIRFKKKLQLLKKEIRSWVANYKKDQSRSVTEIKSKLRDIDKLIDQGGVHDDLLLSRNDPMKQLQVIKSTEDCDRVQKAKIQWAIEGDENSKFYHGIINRKRANLSIKGIMVDGEWVDDPSRVKEEFRSYFSSRFQPSGNSCSRLNFRFPNLLSHDQAADLEIRITQDEIRTAVWNCGENKSPGPDGFTFELFHKFWDVIGADFCVAVEWFFQHSSFTKGCNSFFIALIPKILDSKFVSDYRPISLIGSLYKVVTKVLATRLSFVIFGLVSDVKQQQHAMVFKVDFAKAYDSIRWDYLDDVLDWTYKPLDFGSEWAHQLRIIWQFY
ncbi:hypothetical protein Tco_0446753 [Tanacetum coccineum]